MVARGQFLERATVIPVGGICLEGLWHRGDARPALLIVPPHPRRGASMDAPVCAELAFAASRRGHPTLRFNFRGAGGSQGALAGLEACVEDARAARAVLEANLGESAPAASIAVAGYDYGARVAVELARALPGALHSVALLAPPPDGDDDGAALADAAAELDVPLLIAGGERDATFDRRAWGELCARGGDRFVLVPGADHGFSAGLSALGREVAAWLSGDAPDLGES